MYKRQDKDFTTVEDRDLDRIDALKEHLRERPLWPADPRDPSGPYRDAQGGMRLPLVHCAFQNCTWYADTSTASDGEPLGPLRQWSLEYRLYQHLIRRPDGHGDIFAPEAQAVRDRAWPTLRMQAEETFLRVISFYLAAVAAKEREGMPVIGLSKDRQILRGIHGIMDLSLIHI